MGDRVWGLPHKLGTFYRPGLLFLPKLLLPYFGMPWMPVSGRGSKPVLRTT